MPMPGARSLRADTEIESNWAPVGGGNSGDSSYSVISGGYGNTAGLDANYSVIGGGYSNVNNNGYGTIAAVCRNVNNGV